MRNEEWLEKRATYAHKAIEFFFPVVLAATMIDKPNLNIFQFALCALFIPIITIYIHGLRLSENIKLEAGLCVFSILVLIFLLFYPASNKDIPDVPHIAYVLCIMISWFIINFFLSYATKRPAQFPQSKAQEASAVSEGGQDDVRPTGPPTSA